MITSLKIKESLKKLREGFQLDNIIIDKGWLVASLRIRKIIKASIDRFLHIKKPLNEVTMDRIINFSAYTRNVWIAEKAKTLKQGAKVLDAGAGQCPYRELFAHCDYKTHDFAQYQGTTSGTQIETWEYGNLDYISDITKIPVPDKFFNAVLCTEVLEHVPKPIEAIKEISRVLVSGGRLFLTAPLCSGLHQQPFHYYGGFSPHFYKKFLTEFNLEIVEIKPIGGLLKLVGQEVLRTGRILEENAPEKLSSLAKYVLKNWLPVYLSNLDDEVFVEEFTVGYLVEAKKIN